ncbi:MAG TPA: hypothetical protein VFP55_10060 [Solirubrobacteraceae bacterium]|nr:hypothetical protein [Solirubrobacteraceae bacterium]
MPALFRRSRREDAAEDDVPAGAPRQSIAALIADHLEAELEEAPVISHREFRELARERRRSQDEALAEIRAAARTRGSR